jgi:hypothetical protein
MIQADLPAQSSLIGLYAADSLNTQKFLVDQPVLSSLID